MAGDEDTVTRVAVPKFGGGWERPQRITAIPLRDVLLGARLEDNRCTGIGEELSSTLTFEYTIEGLLLPVSHEALTIVCIPVCLLITRVETGEELDRINRGNTSSKLSHTLLSKVGYSGAFILIQLRQRKDKLIVHDGLDLTHTSNVWTLGQFALHVQVVDVFSLERALVWSVGKAGC